MKFQRHMEMLEYIANHGSVTIEELMARFQISKATLNRDIGELVKTGNIERVHGGVVSAVNSGEFEMLINDKERMHIAEKEAIAKRTCELIQDNDTIIIDSGSTMYYVAKELAKNKSIQNVTVITNDIKVAYTLCSNENISIVVMGGMKHSDGYDLYGIPVSNVISSLNVNKYFMATSAFDVEGGVTHTNYEDIQTKKQFLELARECILCVDSKKVGLVKRFRLCDIEMVDCIVVDDGLSQDNYTQLKDKGVHMIIA